MIISRTPLRISLFGGGTDFPDYYRTHGGLCLSTAIDKYVYVALKSRPDGRIRLSYTRTETVDSPGDLQHELIREALKLYDVRGGMEIATMADIPGAGSGLASSSAVTVGVLNALRAGYNWINGPEAIAADACRIECDFLKKTPGKQDQYIAAYGGFRIIKFCILAGGPRGGREVIVSGEFRPKTLKRLEENLLLFFTGQTRQAEPLLAEQNKRNGQNLDALHQMKLLAIDAIDRINNDLVDAIGPLLDEAWQLKKSLSPGISNDGLNAMYEAARGAGATGGKICGAGGGGYLLLYCPDETARRNVRYVLSSYQELKFKFELAGSVAKRVF